MDTFISLLPPTTILLLILLQTTASSYHGPTEYCQWEDFNAQCDEDEMIVFRNAVYGRMQLGRCVTRDFGFIGCGSDVLPTMHRQCSGRRECDFDVTNLHGNHDCSNDLTAYLAASYECIKVVSCERKMCETSDYLKVATPSGYLSSEVTFASGCGTATCPWVVQALPGQRINITLLDFSGGTNRATGRTDPRKVCYRYATLKEANTITRDLTICVGDERAPPTNHVYMSETETVSVTLYTADNKDELFYFALRYEVLGCPTLAPPKNSWMKRVGDDVTVYCNATKREWHLRCAGTSWIGEVGACNQEADWSIHPIDGDSPAFGMLVIIGMGVAIGVVIGGLLLAVTLIYLKRRSHTPEVRSNPLLGEGGLYGERVARYDHQGGGGEDSQNQKNTLTMAIKQEMPSGEHDYTCTLPYRHVGRDPRSPRCQTSFPEDSGVESAEFGPIPELPVHVRADQPHVYESPTFPLQPVPLRGGRTQSADGISRKISHEEASSNKTN